MVLVPQVLDLFWSAIEREVEKQGRTATFDRLRGIARRLPYAVRRLLFRSVHTQFGGGLRLFATAGAFLPPALQQAWEDMGVIVIQGYGATETFAGAATTMNDHPLGCVGWPPKPVEMRIVEDGEIQFRGPSLSPGYWDDPEATAAAFTEDGWYKSGDLGAFDDKGRLHLHGRKKDIIVLPNGFNVFPEDLENALRVAGIRDSVAIETKPGRIEAVVLAAGDARGSGRSAGGAGARERGARGRAARDRRRGEGRQPVARAQPADRRLARLARGGLPAHPHVQGQARPGAGVGRDQRAAAGGRRGLRPGRSRRPPAPAAGQEGVTGSPIVASVEASRAISGSGETSGEYEKNTSVEPTRRTTNCVVARVLDRAGPRGEVGHEVLADPVGLAVRRQLVDDDVALVGVGREHGLDDPPRDVDQGRRSRRAGTASAGR